MIFKYFVYALIAWAIFRSSWRDIFKSQNKQKSRRTKDKKWITYAISSLSFSLQVFSDFKLAKKAGKMEGEPGPGGSPLPLGDMDFQNLCKDLLRSGEISSDG